MLHQYGAWLIRLSINQDTVNAGFKRLYSAVGTEIFEVPQKHPSSSRVTTSPQHTRQLSVSDVLSFTKHSISGNSQAPNGDFVCLCGSTFQWPFL